MYLQGDFFKAVAHRVLQRGGEFQVRHLGNIAKETIALPKPE